MSIISKDKNVIKIFYNSQSRVGRHTLSYLEASYKDILAIDNRETKITGTQYAEFADELNCKISDFVDQKHPSFKEHYESGKILSEEDWIKVLNSHPDVLVYPIVLLGEKYFHIKNPSEVEYLLQPNSQGLDEQNPL